MLVSRRSRRLIAEQQVIVLPDLIQDQDHGPQANRIRQTFGRQILGPLEVPVNQPNAENGVQGQFHIPRSMKSIKRGPSTQALIVQMDSLLNEWLNALIWRHAVDTDIEVVDYSYHEVVLLIPSNWERYVLHRVARHRGIVSYTSADGLTHLQRPQCAAKHVDLATPLTTDVSDLESDF